MKKSIFFCLVFFIFLLLFSLDVNASTNEIKDINMDVYIETNGDAYITEIWKTNLNQGTEGYRSFSNINSDSISEFSVTDDLGNNYEYISNWNASDSFEHKSYKCGKNSISNGVELCWGISKYGYRTYTLKYKIKDMVTQYTDTQGIYFNFLDLDNVIGNATIEIHSDLNFSLENAKIWAFGNNGDINFYRGKIILNSNGKLKKNQYMVALIRFESNLFNIDNFSNESFDNIYDEAISGVELEKKINNDSKLFIFAIIVMLIFFVFIFPKLLKLFTKQFPKINNLIIILFIIFLIFIYPPAIILGIIFIYFCRRNYTVSELDFGREGKDLPDESEIPYYREVPCDKDITKLYWVAYNYKLFSPSILKKGVIGAILLKWIKEEKVKVIKTKSGLFNLKDNNYAIDLKDNNNITDDVENGLYKILYEAAGENSILEAKEFEKWCKKFYVKVDSWFDDIIKKGEEKFIAEKAFSISTKKEKNTFGAEKTINILHVKNVLKEEAKKIIGLKKFLLEYSLINEREHIEVHIWQEYLIFAQLIGIADKVKEQFSKLYPDFKDDELLKECDVDEMDVVTDFSELAYKTVSDNIISTKSSKSNRKHDYSGTSRDSGGGGKSYHSGGKSSNGSSGGGFR